MKTFITKLVFQVHGGETVHFDEQWRFVLGVYKEDAYAKSIELGDQENEIIVRHDGTQCHWEFVALVDIMEIDSTQDGAFIFSRTEEPDHVGHYIQTVRQRAEQVETFTLASTSV